jgi:ring-1,2-phenylacetyl-CoA epoxidase subunit PaaE
MDGKTPIINQGMRSLQVTKINRKYQDTSIVHFHLPENMWEEFSLYPGQYITLEFTINNKKERRCYSLSNSPYLNEELQIAVKKVDKGLVSNYIYDYLKEGDLVNVLPPEGAFYCTPNKSNYKTYYLFAAGSGITPIYSILKSVLEVEPDSYVNLIFGNRTKDSIIFFEELQSLQASYPERLQIVYYLSRQKASWSDLWKAEDKTFNKGRVDDKAIKEFINNYPPYAQNAEYYICGPDTMIDNTVQSLRDIDVPVNRIFKESFGTSSNKAAIGKYIESTLTASLQGENSSHLVKEGDSILTTLLNDGKNPPYSCNGGVCGKCKCKLTNGSVEMNNKSALSEEEINDGWILSCQAHPTSKETSVVFK